MAKTGRGCRNKGTRAETELVEILDEQGIPSQRVLGSGSFIGAKADLKVGIQLNEDGEKPSPDESAGIMRAEVKNRKTNPEYFFDPEDQKLVASLGFLSKKCPEFIFDYLNQDQISKLLILRRAKIKPGDMKNKKYNDTHVVVMGLQDFIEFFKKAFPDVVVAVSNDDEEERE